MSNVGLLRAEGFKFCTNGRKQKVEAFFTEAQLKSISRKLYENKFERARRNITPLQLSAMCEFPVRAEPPIPRLNAKR